ncbi:hypothetical protein D5041_01825 [Verminephrobacter aporrectodeae subsp. tuberculatae]|uniref:AfsA-related hotdog domain-containing protein n=1 Tax=Verminephrobacter aporrectodeae TaxID=1110389 RepID=UPI002237200D|nr:AfsA-related hotdog domain-containing protein [Verminephrobacter aporrectodeae]MCW5222377.1 hypothetical protein [Verminephrobacter aporrectodeae subsp. tuberculatae]MCW5287841.1 hypothetical protein [Verminephrobacter aporrectodeae subsp. tuberculatae]
MAKSGIVVGDCFSGFSSVDGVFTVSELVRRLRQLDDVGSDAALPTLLIWGQGVSDSDRASLIRLIRRTQGRVAITTARESQPTPASYSHVHKHEPQNVLISVPKRADEHRFVADLLIDARNELLLDHVTGQHVQGMVLIEAVRQMFLAVTKEHLFNEQTPVKTYFVIKSMKIDYKFFVFPVDASVSFRPDKIKHGDDGRLSVTASVGVWQQGIECATSVVSYSVFDADHIRTREFALADACVRGVLGMENPPYPIISLSQDIQQDHNPSHDGSQRIAS